MHEIRFAPGKPPPHTSPPRRLRRLDLGAFGASASTPSASRSRRLRRLLLCPLPQLIIRSRAPAYLSASAVVNHYEEALYQVYAPLPLPLCIAVYLGSAYSQSLAYSWPVNTPDCSSHRQQNIT